MKKMFILTALLGLTVAASGCNCFPRLFRGPRAEPCPAPACAVPCAPACNTCDPCAAGPSVVTPGPEAYAPAPTS